MRTSRDGPSFLFSIAALLAIPSGACGGGVSSEPVPQPSSSGLAGDYGYESPGSAYAAAKAGVRLSGVSYDFLGDAPVGFGSTATFQCIHGESGPIVPDANGAFTAQGTLTTTSTAAIVTHSNVTFSGTASANILVLTASWPSTITTSTGAQASTETVGPMTLTRGVVPTQYPGCI
jgi:hypothetical protein